jgi:hypothetical protein
MYRSARVSSSFRRVAGAGGGAKNRPTETDNVTCCRHTDSSHCSEEPADARGLQWRTDDVRLDGGPGASASARAGVVRLALEACVGLGVSW